MNCDLRNKYSKYNFFSRLKDDFNTHLIGESFIKDLNMTIAHVKLPPNFDNKAYLRNVERAKRFVKESNVYISPKTLRTYDFNILNSFQKKLLVYSVVKTIQLILRMKQKSIKNSCILINDSSNEINRNIAYELCKYAKYIVLLSKQKGEASKLSNYILANYGVSPVVTDDDIYAIDSADFIVTSRDIDINKNVPIWYIDNDYKPNRSIGLNINDVNYKVPWNDNSLSDMPPELLGAILCQMDEKEVEKSLKYNGIYLNTIKFNDKNIEL
jgi:hypothetical protein